MSELLREVVEELAPLERRAGSEDEREAAERLRARLTALGLAARVEEVPFRDGYARQLLPLGAAGAATGVVALAGGARLPAVLAGTLAAGAIADDAANGRRHWRRLVTRPRMTSNVVAETGDSDAERTLVLLAHHDAAPTGRVFDPSLQRTLARHFPELVQRTNASLPLWWPIIGGPALVALGAATGRRVLLAAGTALSFVNTALGADIARDRIVPGRERQPLRRRRPRRHGRAPARGAARRAARAALLVRRGGGAAGRHLRLRRRATCAGSIPRARGCSTSTRSARRSW